MKEELNCNLFLILFTFIQLIDFNRYHCDPSGTFVQYEAKAIGAASEGAQNSLKEHLLVESTDENGKPKFERKVSKFVFRKLLIDLVTKQFKSGNQPRRS